MISLTASHLIKIYGITTARATIWQPHLDASMLRFDITTAIRAAMFIAQVGHESGRLAYVREVWNPARNPAQTGQCQNQAKSLTLRNPRIDTISG